jgi:predicted transcriptional regulator
MIKTGRPRLDDSPTFREGFATILPRLIAKEISQGQAARELGISVRSLKRYVKQGEGLVSPLKLQ